MAFRTDLALEAAETARGEAGRLPGVRSRVRSFGSTVVTEVEILDARGEDALGRPRGSYVTVELEKIAPYTLPQAAEVVAGELRALLRRLEIGQDAEAMVAGLGNRRVTPDTIGPLAAEHVIATRHLVGREKSFDGWRPVSVISPGVLGTTGIESAEVVLGAVRRTSPAVLIVVDALAAGNAGRLCRTVQLADSGISPGSGVGNSRAELSRGTIGVPVIAVGVPTVVDADTLCGGAGCAPAMFVTPREIDRLAALSAKLVGHAINMALHGMTLEEAESFSD